MDTIAYLRPQNDLLTEIKAKTRLGSTARWTDTEYKYALNEILMVWSDKVKFPHIYTITDGWQASDYDYALPRYVRPPIYPQLKRQMPYYDYAVESATHTWQDVPGYELEPDGSGGHVLRLFSPPRNVDARVIYYAPNSRVPTADTAPTTSGSTSSTATTMTIGSAVDVDDVGHIKVNAEYMAYTISERNASTTVLTLTERALYGSTAATHNTASSVYWCVAADTLSLYANLFDCWKAYLHAYFLQDGGTKEVARHEKALGLYEQKMANFLATYSPQRRRGGLTLNRKSFAFR
jgi:hypothetical protein